LDAGRARTSDGRVEVDLDIPKEMGGTGGSWATRGNIEVMLLGGAAAAHEAA